MKTPVLCVVVLSLLGSVVRAQQAPVVEKVPVPAPPMIKQAPAYAAWTIRYDPVKEAPGTAKPPPRPKETDVTKTKDIRREVTLWSDGSTGEAWKYGALIIEKDRVGKFVNVHDPVKAGEGGSNITKSDFIDLAWVSAKDFVGKVELPGHSCYYFKHASSARPAPVAGKEESNQEDLTQVDIGESAEAWIDVDTRLPVVVKDARGTRHYEFGAAPDAMLALPADLQKELDRYLSALRDTARYLAPPHR